jgi:hypothetical protein
MLNLRKLPSSKPLLLRAFIYFFLILFVLFFFEFFVGVQGDRV